MLLMIFLDFHLKSAGPPDAKSERRLVQDPELVTCHPRAKFSELNADINGGRYVLGVTASQPPPPLACVRKKRTKNV